MLLLVNNWNKGKKMKQLILGLFITFALSSLSYGVERGATTVDPKDSVTIQVFEQVKESCQINYKDIGMQVYNAKKIILKQQRCKQVVIDKKNGSQFGFMGKITIIK